MASSLQYYIPTLQPQPDLSKSKLIIPTISIGNIPQLTIDLLIHTYNFNKIGILNDTFLYPFASPIDYSPQHSEPKEGISHAIEIYHNNELNLVVVQQRSPIIPSYTSLFVQNVINPFIKHSGIQKVVLLNSQDLGLVKGLPHQGGSHGFNNETELENGHVEVFSLADLMNCKFEELKLSSASITETESETRNNTSNDANIDDDESFAFVKSIFQAFDVPTKTLESKAASNNSSNSTNSISSSKVTNHESTLKGLDLTVLVSYAYESDNFHDAETMMQQLKEELNLLPKFKDFPLIKPVSWRGAYGDRAVPNAIEEGIFG